MSRRLIIRPQDLHGDDLVPRIVRHLTEEIRAAEDAGDSQKAESLLMDLNIIMELALAGGGDVQKAIESIEVGELRDQVLDLRDQIATALKNNDPLVAAKLRACLWELLDTAWQERRKLKSVPLQHEHVSTADFDKRMK